MKLATCHKCYGNHHTDVCPVYDGGPADPDCGLPSVMLAGMAFLVCAWLALFGMDGDDMATKANKKNEFSKALIDLPTRDIEVELARRSQLQEMNICYYCLDSIEEHSCRHRIRIDREYGIKGDGK